MTANRYVRFNLFLLSAVFLSACAVYAAAKATNPKPNVIFILTDDQGWGDLSIAGHPCMRTPNLDRLAKEGTRFTQFYVNATVCAPSRVSLMTGRYPAWNNVHHIYLRQDFNIRHGMPDYLDHDAFTVADLMKKAGYTTAHIGKWHLEGRDIASPPSNYGFDEWLVTHDASQSPIYKERFASTEHRVTRASHWIVDDVIDFIDRQKDSGKPFYLNLWTLVPHGLLLPTPEELAEYKDLQADPDDFESWMKDYAHAAENFTAQMKVFCAAMTSTDQAFGRLFDYLDKTGLAENTIIVFTSDNGPEDYHVGDAKNAGVGSPGVARGRKRSIYEGGIRVPCIVRWPGRVPAGKVSDAVWSGVDLMPTLAAITGADVADPSILDGEDVTDIWMGSNRKRSKDLFWEWKYEVKGNPDYKPPQLAVRSGDWKFLCDPDGSNRELYNIADDPAEMHNRAADFPERASELKARLLAWKKIIPERFER
ncbi:MAG TPA: sulfatase-like hydrolase/transferase [Tichowtungia sp.]|nr:sulfatase-like hydrolase/transferase [Tichowtungia sp.]